MPPPLSADPVPEAAPSVGEVLTVSADHLRGIHVTPRADCWRCQRDVDPELAPALEPTDAVAAPS